jgi:uncharacterized membrane protein (UPF0182 family)
VVAVREINLAGIPEGQRNWTNERAVFTHGYGLVAAYDNTALSNGQPDFFESNIPPTGGLEVAEPRVYFGELSPTYSIVGAPEGSQPIELDIRTMPAQRARRPTRTRAMAASRWAASSAGCCSRPSSRTATSCCPT